MNWFQHFKQFVTSWSVSFSPSAIGAIPVRSELFSPGSILYWTWNSKKLVEVFLQGKVLGRYLSSVSTSTYRTGSFLPAPIPPHTCWSNTSVADPGSEFFPSRIPEMHQSILTQESVFKLSEIWSGLFIPDPGFGSWFFTHPGSRIHGSERHRIPDPQLLVIPGYWYYWIRCGPVSTVLYFFWCWTYDVRVAFP